MTLAADTTCTATFNKTGGATSQSPPTPPLPPEMTVFVQMDGSGTVSTDTGLSCARQDCQPDSNTGELTCQANCQQIVKTGSTVTLILKANTNSIFSDWGGNEDCVDGTLSIDSGKLCVAYFHRLYQLTVTVQGPDQVTGNTVGYNSTKTINCGQGQTQCNNIYESTIADSLQAQPLGNAQFQGWRRSGKLLEFASLTPTYAGLTTLNSHDILFGFATLE